LPVTKSVCFKIVFKDESALRLAIKHERVADSGKSVKAASAESWRAIVARRAKGFGYFFCDKQ